MMFDEIEFCELCGCPEYYTQSNINFHCPCDCHLAPLEENRVLTILISVFAVALGLAILLSELHIHVW